MPGSTENFHYKLQCTSCGRIYSQCRCPAPDKMIRRQGECIDCLSLMPSSVSVEASLDEDHSQIDRFARILGLCEFNHWKFRVGSDNAICWLQVRDPNGIDNVTGERLNWGGRKWRLSEHMTKSEVVQTAFLAVMTAMEHEIREQFKYRGQLIFRPHHDVDQLHDFCATTEMDSRK